MKLKVLYIATALFLTNIATAQVLYTENFNNLTVGNVGTDITGQTPGQGGWYTKIVATPNSNLGSNNDFKITPETNRGNILEIEPPLANSGVRISRFFFREDISLFWNNRTPNNTIFKLSFDLYTDETRTEPWGAIRNFIIIYNKEGHVITNLYFDGSTKELK